ncbi:hypothetical protein B0T22DRAFT_143108 [Podospora appendiculata]|uniref:Uncharacterized protein n=1 Tax=Podospora appendiculata TaxID=314037 RepID=A0AAE1CC25_9PEZI|nr:hypothetical protein B0T22DRAFT_143108 [Podospora appendiculata]
MNDHGREGSHQNTFLCSCRIENHQLFLACDHITKPARGLAKKLGFFPLTSPSIRVALTSLSQSRGSRKSTFIAFPSSCLSSRQILDTPAIRSHWPAKPDAGGRRRCNNRANQEAGKRPLSADRCAFGNQSLAQTPTICHRDPSITVPQCHNARDARQRW